MIKTFKNEHIEMFFHGDYSNKRLEKIVPKHLFKNVTSKLIFMDEAISYEDLLVYKLKDLQGNLKGFKSIRINRQYRIIFKIDELFNCYDVDIVDYH